jgi:hypothetical protein
MTTPVHPPLPQSHRSLHPSPQAIAGGAPLALGMAIALAWSLLPGWSHADPYAPIRAAAPRFGEVHYGDTQEVYSSQALTHPTGHQAPERTFGDQGPIPKGVLDGTTPGCQVSSFEGIAYFRCDPHAPRTSQPAAPPWPLAPPVSRLRGRVPSGEPD